MEIETKCKAILSLRLATHLIRKGFDVWKIVPSLKVDGYQVFMFERTPELETAIEEFRTMRDNERR